MTFLTPDQPPEVQLVELLRPLALKYSNRVTVAPIEPQSWAVGQPVSVQLTAVDSDATVTSFTWSVFPALPPGVVLEAETGLIHGRPVLPLPLVVYVVSASDYTTAAGVTSLALQIAPEPNTVSVEAIPDQTDWTGDSVSVQCSAVDTDPSETFAWSGSKLPAGLTVNPSSGVITGTLITAQKTTAGTVTATDTTGASGSALVNWTVEPGKVSIAAIPDQSTTVGETVTIQLSVSSTNPNAAPLGFTMQATGLPDGITLDSKTGVLAGAATAEQPATPVTITATDPWGAAGTLTLSWTVTPAAAA